jgi:hypothetical protein
MFFDHNGQRSETIAQSYNPNDSSDLHCFRQPCGIIRIRASAQDQSGFANLLILLGFSNPLKSLQPTFSGVLGFQ